MKIIETMKEMLISAEEYVPVKGFYYADHSCDISGEVVRVRMEHTIKDLRTNDIVHIGACPHCKKAFYHSTYETHTL